MQKIIQMRVYSSVSNDKMSLSVYPTYTIVPAPPKAPPRDLPITPPFFFPKGLYCFALAGVAQWIECWLANQRVTGSIPSQGTCLGCRSGPQCGVCEQQPHVDVSLPLFLLPFSLKLIFLKKGLYCSDLEFNRLALPVCKLYNGIISMCSFVLGFSLILYLLDMFLIISC